jgi:hypothetical protein
LTVVSRWVPLASAGNARHNSEASQNDHAYDDPLLRHVQKMRAQGQPDNQDYVPNQVNSERHFRPPFPVTLCRASFVFNLSNLVARLPKCAA